MKILTILLMAVLTACSTGSPGGGPSSSPSESAIPSVSPPATQSPAPTISPVGNIVWKAGASKWMIANTYQCGTPILTGSTYTFNLKQNGQKCGRNQILPLTSGGTTFTIHPGQNYTFSFHYIDGKPDGSGPGMGPDAGIADSLIFQVHPWNCGSGTLGVRLNFIDNTTGVGYGNEHWGFYAPESEGIKLLWVGTYKPGEQDDFKIVLAPLSATASGVTKFYRNGVLQFTTSGPNYVNCDGHDPWFNFGPYKWRWELPAGGGSKMTEVNATVENFTLTSP